jgi:hypothetical protein
MSRLSRPVIVKKGRFKFIYYYDFGKFRAAPENMSPVAAQGF